MNNDHPHLRGTAPTSDAAIAFKPRWVEATRVVPYLEEFAPFMSDDSFQLTLGDSDDGLRHCVLSIEFNRAVPVGDPIHLQVSPSSRAAFGPPNDGRASLAIQRARRSDVEFTFLHGSDEGDDDPGDFDAVMITFVAIPAEYGDPLTLRVHVHFLNEQILDATFSARLASGWA